MLPIPPFRGTISTTIDENEKNPMIFSPNLVGVMETGCTVLLRGQGYGKAMLPGRSLSPGAIDNVYCMWYPPPRPILSENLLVFAAIYI